MTFKIPPAMHVAICAVILALTVAFAVATIALLLQKQPVPPELWKLSGGSLMVYLGLKATPGDADSAA